MFKATILLSILLLFKSNPCFNQIKFDYIFIIKLKYIFYSLGSIPESESELQIWYNPVKT